MTSVLNRRAGRVLLIDAQGRVLLFRGCDPARPDVYYWFTVGGGLDPGETTADAAIRELREETGLVVASVGEVVWSDVAEFTFEGQAHRQVQDFYVVGVESWTVSRDGHDAVERRSIDQHRWWSVDELATTDEVYYPRELATVLRGILEP
jgi:8-oxo-dGTP pyrophosphatase MutT (NUDIX family)